LYLNGDKGVFEVTPREGINEASFLIRVKNPAMLDYEQVKSITPCKYCLKRTETNVIFSAMNFTLVAKETVPNNAKYSSVPVTVYIRDMNDNFPEFTEPLYEVKNN
jgi:cadherin 23